VTKDRGIQVTIFDIEDVASGDEDYQISVTGIP
jgi:hypothetical protein